MLTSQYPAILLRSLHANANANPEAPEPQAPEPQAPQDPNPSPPSPNPSNKMSGWSIFFLTLFILLLLIYLSWILLTQLRARRSNLPPPSWQSYLFIGSAGPAYGSHAPTPRRGGVVGWVKDKIAEVRRGRNRRTARGAYEERLRGDQDQEVWDERVGGGGYLYEEQELGFAPAPVSGSGSGAGAGAFDGQGQAGLSAGAHVEDRGRSRSRSRERSPVPPPPPYDAPAPGEDPFGDGAERSDLRDVSPRPDGGKAQSADESRRSMFSEGL